MTGMPAALKARVIADCKTSTEKLTTSLPWQPQVTAKPSDAHWDPVKAQVSEICIGIKIGTERVQARQERMSLVNTTGAFRRDLRKYAAETLAKASTTRARRHYLTDDAERRTKLIDETGFDTTGALVEPPAEQWARPQAMTLYHKLMLAAPGQPSVDDYAIGDLKHLAWMIEAELLDIDADGRIHLLSDVVLPTQRRYPGSPVLDDKKAGQGYTHTAEDVQHFVLEVWEMIADGHPPMDINGDYRDEMTTKNGLRMSGRTLTYQCNKLLAARIDARCNCLGRDQVKYAWDLPDHGKGCAGRERWLSIDVVRRAIRELMESGDLHRTDEAHLTRRGHTEHRTPAAYAIPADAGWHRYAKQRRIKHAKPRSRLRDRLLGDAKAAAVPLPSDAWEAA